MIARSPNEVLSQLQFCKAITHAGRTFTAGGAWIGRHHRTGRYGGLFYAYPQEGTVGTWHGDRKVPAHFGRVWRSNLGDERQHVTFMWEGVPFSGVYYRSKSDMVRVKEVRPSPTVSV